MNVKEKIIEAQMAIIKKLSACEEAISTLYATYEKTIPGMEDFWRELSKIEKAHAGLLMSLRKQLEDGDIFRNIGRFDSAMTDAFLKRLQDEIARAKESPLSREEAVKTAYGIETSILDAHFYDIVESDSAGYRMIADRLSVDTNDHVALVRNKLLEIQSDSVHADYLSRLPTPPEQRR